MDYRAVILAVEGDIGSRCNARWQVGRPWLGVRGEWSETHGDGIPWSRSDVDLAPGTREGEAPGRACLDLNLALVRLGGSLGLPNCSQCEPDLYCCAAPRLMKARCSTPGTILSGWQQPMLWHLPTRVLTPHVLLRGVCASIPHRQSQMSATNKVALERKR